MDKEERKKQLRRELYTPDYYRNLKKEKGFRWRDVPFICIECGDVFTRTEIKPRTLPVNCSNGCRMDAFNGTTVGGLLSLHIKDLNWPQIRTLINSGKSGPEISKLKGVALTTLHKYSKKKLGMHFLKKLIENGKKRRRQGQKAHYLAKVD